MIYKLGDLMPSIGENNFIAENATVIGDVRTGNNVSIWFNAVLRGDLAPIIIGDDSNVQDNVTLHVDYDTPVELGNGVTIGHNAIIHGCKIGDNSVIGMGATLLNKVVIPKNCLVAAGSVVGPKLKIEEGDLVVGNPARIARKMSEDNIAYLSKTKKIYTDDIEIYLTQLEKIK
ncbi:gamma carbonic anhydrase family protein [uncultured Ilyobacter sp.]|uniref:gamma carbonic anhydrase family protein n=1 Tax=uncultured Ilyobacter sp. TaxID=544433 RepID=UPI0029C8ACFC|nr:gamma carbonic anhydrase family protein [uncultured Ilyobacter sp.]